MPWAQIQKILVKNYSIFTISFPHNVEIYKGFLKDFTKNGRHRLIFFLVGVDPKSLKHLLNRVCDSHMQYIYTRM